MLEAKLAEAVFAQATPNRYLVALSGGIDSTVLMHALVKILPRDAQIIALHGNHQLRDDAAQWQRHCRTGCEKLGVKLIHRDLVISAHGNLEAAARKARYHFFTSEIQPGDLLLLGHHANDQVETVLLRFFQGRGLIGMRESGALGAGTFLRPLLGISRADVETYANTIGVSWVEDDSNKDLQFDRNFLRHQIVPLLERRWPKISQAISRIAGIAGTQRALLEHLLASEADNVTFSSLPDDDANCILWLRTYLSLRGHHNVPDKRLKEWLRQAKSTGSGEVALGGGCMLRSWRERLYYSVQTVPFEPTSLALGERLPTAFGALKLIECDANAAGSFAYNGPLEVVTKSKLNNPKLRRSFGSVSLKTLFQQGDIPPWCRNDFPLLASQGELVAIPGIASEEKRKDESAQTESTTWCRAILTN